MNQKKTLEEKQLKKVFGGYAGARMIEINYDIQCCSCEYCGHMTYEEGTETGTSRLVYAICPECQALNQVGLGAA